MAVFILAVVKEFTSLLMAIFWKMGYQKYGITNIINYLAFFSLRARICLIVKICKKFPVLRAAFLKSEGVWYKELDQAGVFYGLVCLVLLTNDIQAGLHLYNSLT
jgi:hypothetical protein